MAACIMMERKRDRERILASIIGSYCLEVWVANTIFIFSRLPMSSRSITDSGSCTRTSVSGSGETGPRTSARCVASVSLSR